MTSIKTLLLLSSFSIAAPALAQTRAKVEVRTGCTVVAPTKSMRATTAQPFVWVPDERGVIHMETESIWKLQGRPGSWVEESSIAGYRDVGYLRWNGADLFGTPNVGTISFRFRIEKTGPHLIRLRNRHENPDPTAANDCWFRLDGGPWHKLVDSWGPGGVGVWSYNAFLEDTGAFPQYDLSEGLHTVELSGRSRNFIIDTLHVVPRSVWFANDTDPPAEAEADRPVIGDSFRFEIDDPSGASGMPPGQTMVFAFLGRPGAMAPCGTIEGLAGELLLVPNEGEDPIGPVQWNGPGNPVAFQVPIPARPQLLGMVFTLQGALIDASGRTVLTEALDLHVGDL